MIKVCLHLFLLIILLKRNYTHLEVFENKLASSFNFKEKQHTMSMANTIQGMTWRDFNIPYPLIFISFLPKSHK